MEDLWTLWFAHVCLLQLKSSHAFHVDQSGKGENSSQSRHSGCYSLEGGEYFRNFWVGMSRWDPGTLNLYQS